MVEKVRAMARKLDVVVDGRSPSSPAAAPSPRGWRHRDAGGVGLGILAALEQQPPAAAAAAAAARVSASVAIAGSIASPRRAVRLEVSEPGCSGRCATSVCGGAPAASGAGGAAAFRVAEFLSCCGLCRRPLDGKDIFMYRGERAFCSMECRYEAIVSDEFQERKKEHKRRASSASAPSEIPKKATAAAAAAAEMAGSPCAGGDQIFFTGIVVA